MANLKRSPRSSSKWGFYELTAYNITVTSQRPQEFFCQNSEPPFKLLGVDPLLIDSAVEADNVPDDTLQYLTHLRLGRVTHPSWQESLVTDFSRETLRILGFAERGLALITNFTIPLMICNDRQFAQTDVCLLARQSIILLVLRQDKMLFDESDGSKYNHGPEDGEVIAEAIAVYQYNNKKRETRGLQTLDAMTIPCIAMKHMRPIFYLVPVTRELSDAVVTGQYPQTPTKVVKCVTSLWPDLSIDGGMETPVYRKLAFQHLVTFRDLAKEYWQTFLV